jgi:urease subunit alpha
MTAVSLAECLAVIVISKADMVYNNVCGDIRVDPETYTVTVDGEVITCEPFDELALAQRYFMF